MNGVRMNGVRMNGVRMNGVRMNGANLSGFSFNDLPLDQSLQFFRYLVSCALPEGHTISLTIDGAPYSFAGSIGLAPAMEHGALSDPADQEWVTACLLARANAKAHHCQISLRAAHPAITYDNTDNQLGVPDGGFYGNIFQANPEAHACASGPQADVEDWLSGSLQARGRGAGYAGSGFPMTVDTHCWNWGSDEFNVDVGACARWADDSGFAHEITPNTCSGWTRPIFIGLYAYELEDPDCWGI
jgi:hypothetical protein